MITREYVIEAALEREERERMELAAPPATRHEWNGRIVVIRDPNPSDEEGSAA